VYFRDVARIGAVRLEGTITPMSRENLSIHVWLDQVIVCDGTARSS
jgi:hypothetical protein